MMVIDLARLYSAPFFNAVDLDRITLLRFLKVLF
jgi:hypothetical protein